MTTATVNPFETKVLDPEVHGRFVQNLDKYLKQAGVPKRYVWTPAAESCGAEEIAWLKRFRMHAQEGTAGLCFVGDPPGDPVPDRMMLMTGVLLRNFIDARFQTVAEVLQTLRDGEAPKGTCLLIPDFFMGSDGSKLASWQLGQLYGLLVGRHAAEKQTVLYVSSLKDLETSGGKALVKHIRSNFTLIGA